MFEPGTSELNSEDTRGYAIISIKRELSQILLLLCEQGNRILQIIANLVESITTIILPRWIYITKANWPSAYIMLNWQMEIVVW